MPTRLYVIDGSGYLHRAFHSMRDVPGDGEIPTNVVFGFALLLRNLLRREQPSHLAVVFDAAGESFRHRLFASYKANRRETPQELRVQIPAVLELLDCYGIATLTEPDVEADDVIATLATSRLPNEAELVIISADKDLTQLVGPRVTMWDTMRDRRYGEAEVKERFGVAPQQMTDYLALCGDASDNIPGVPGIGAKTASALLQQFDSLDGLYARLEEVSRARTRELLRTHEAGARLSRALVTLRTSVPLAQEFQDFRYTGPQTARLAAFLRRLRLFSMARDVEREHPGASASTSMPREPGDPGAAPKRAPQHPSPVSATPPQPQSASNAGAEATEPSPGDATDLVSSAGPAPATVEICRNLHDLPRQIAALGRHGALAVAAFFVPESDPEAQRILPLLGLAFGSATRVVYIPTGHRYLGAAQQPSRRDLLRQLAPLLHEQSRSIVCYDSKALHHLFRKAESPPPAVVSDLLLESYLLDPEQPHTLAALAERAACTAIDASFERPSDWPIERLAAQAGQLLPTLLRISAFQRQLLEQREQRALMNEVELPLAALLARIEETGVALDTEKLAQLGESLGDRARELENEIHSLAGRPFNILSPQQLATVLFGELGLPTAKKGRAGFSTDHEVLAELTARHPLPGLVLEYRQLTKLKSTYTDGLARLVDPRSGRIHTHFNQAVTATGRLSSTGPNLQNIPIRTELGASIRGAFVARPGACLLSADYSQIELRILAHLSDDPVLCRAFVEGRDIHSQTASEVFEKPLAEVGRAERQVAKALNFGIMYGMGANRLAREIDVSRQEATRYIRRYFARYAKVRQLLDRFVVEARERGYATTLLNRRRYLPGLSDPSRALRSFSERAAVNTPIQGSAADIIKLAMLRVDERLRREQLSAQMVLQVHDELVFEVEYDALERTRAAVVEEMERVVTLRIPLVVDAADGPTWRDAK